MADAVKVYINGERWNPVPAVRNFGQRLNQLQEILTADCEDDWVVAAKLALPAFGSAMRLLLTPSLSEIVEEYLQPGAGGGKGRHGFRQRDGRRRDRNGRYHGVWRQLIPDVDSMIASWLPGNNMFEARETNFRERMTWAGIDIADRVLWYFLLADLADEFTAQWVSGLMQARFCRTPLGAACTWRQAPYLNSSSAVWSERTPTSVTNATGWRFGGRGVIRPPEHNQFSGEFGCTIYGIGASKSNDPQGTIQLRCRVTLADGSIQTFLGPRQAVNQGTTINATLELGGNGIIQWFYDLLVVADEGTPLPLAGFRSSGYQIGELTPIPAP